MDAYTGFAQVYDLFMEDTPYEEWCDYLTGLLREHGVDGGLVLDLCKIRTHLPGNGCLMLRIRLDRSLPSAMAQKDYTVMPKATTTSCSVLKQRIILLENCQKKQ